MHSSVMDALKTWIDVHKEVVGSRVADLGALNLNGSVKEVLPYAVGFDIAAGEGVDVVIENGNIPPDWRHYFDAVVSISSFQFCSDTRLYKKEILDLLSYSGLVFLTCCNFNCNIKHTTSEITEDKHRLKPYEVQDLFQPEIFLSYTPAGNGHDMIFEGQLK